MLDIDGTDSLRAVSQAKFLKSKDSCYCREISVEQDILVRWGKVGESRLLR